MVKEETIPPFPLSDRLPPLVPSRLGFEHSPVPFFQSSHHHTLSFPLTLSILPPSSPAHFADGEASALSAAIISTSLTSIACIAVSCISLKALAAPFLKRYSPLDEGSALLQ